MSRTGFSSGLAAGAAALLAAGLLSCSQPGGATKPGSTKSEAAAEPAAPQYPGAAVRGAPVETASGLKYYDLVVGSGAQPRGRGSRVTVHYTGWLEDGTKFDSSVDKGVPFTRSLSMVIGGWTEGVATMRVGGKRKLIIPSQLGYGERGFANLIPPGATLVFDIELLGIVGE